MTRENSMFRLGGEILGMISSAKYCVEINFKIISYFFVTEGAFKKTVE